MDQEIDELLVRMDEIKRNIKEYLEDTKRKLSCDKIVFAHTRRYRYTFEVPIEYAHLMEKDDNFFVTTKLKHTRRFLTNELSNLTTQLTNEEVVYKARISPLIRDMFERFYQNRMHWSCAIKCMAEIDALISLAEVSNERNMVKPIIHPCCDKPFMKIMQMRHPLLERKYDKEFVANDIKLDFDNQRTILITGPNMGGKSTLLRTSCLIVIMAQVGCFVPADFAEFSAVDQIFTRLGASDKILENKSTFFLELEETKFVLDQATQNSLVIMDELGRGTSTFDGYSLAYSVLKYLHNVNQSRLLFTTHYHWLVDDFKDL